MEMTQYIALFVAALFIGMSKTGIQGVSMIAVPLMAIVFGAKSSTGLILPMLCVADLIAVLYYRRSAEWRYILRLLPTALLGFGVALFVDRFIAADQFKFLMGGCLILVVAVMLWSERKGQGMAKLTGNRWYSGAFGLLGGFTTMIGNAAGPVMAIFLMTLKLPKYSFVGTNAWFFLVVNYLKIPIQIFAWDNINTETLLLNLYSIPFIVVGGVLGVWIVKVISNKWFYNITLLMTVISIMLMFFS